MSYSTHKELMWNLVTRNLKIRYKNSTLGFLWTLLNPVFLILIYYVFIRLMRFSMDLVELLSGVLPWHFMSMTLGDSVETISGNASLITKVRFPRILLPLSTLAGNFIHFLLSMFVLFLFLPLLGCSFSMNVFLLIPGIFLITIFTTGLTLILATSNVYFKDTPHLLSVGMMAWFFMTPIIYPLSQIPERFHHFTYFNPMTGILFFFRSAFLKGSSVFSPLMMGLTLIVVLFTFWAGIKLFFRHEPIFADEL